VITLARTKYVGFNHTHLTEMLAEREGVMLSRSTVRNILVKAGLTSPRRRRPPRYRYRRVRMPREGMLIQMDGSDHDWLEGRGTWLTLLLAVDDATGTVPYAIFRTEEDTDGYFLLLEGVIRRRGIPLALYTDRHSVFKHPQSICQEDGRARNTGQTQFGRALKELGISLILARSPQAKGRIEKAGGTFQDRLVAELRLAGASTMVEANCVLADFFPRFNGRFGVPPQQIESVYRPADPKLDLAAILCCRETRKVARDNTVKYQWRTLQLLPNSSHRSYAGTHVEIRDYPDGRLVVIHQGQAIPTREAPPRPGYFHSDNRSLDSETVPIPQWLESVLKHDRALSDSTMLFRSTSPRRPTPRQQTLWEAVQAAKNRGLSQRAIAKLLGVSRNTVSKYVSAAIPPFNRPVLLPTVQMK